MPDETNLNADAKLAIRGEVERTIAKIAAVFGIANLAVVAGAIWMMWNSMTAQTATIADRVKADILGELSSNRNELNTAVNQANQLIGKLEQSQTDMTAIELNIGQMKDDLSKLSDGDAVSQAAAFLQAWKGAPDAAGVIERVDALVEQPGCSNPRIFNGRTKVGGTDWKQYKTSKHGTYTVIDTSDAKFSTPPIYFASLGGTGGHWYVSGSASIYSPKKDAFSLYVQWLNPDYGKKKPIVAYAKSSNWHVNWLAIGC